VLHRSGDSPAAAQARNLAELIPGVGKIDVPGEDYLFFVGDTGPMLDAIEEFLTGALPAHRADRVLATVLYTDIVRSTEQLTRLGDRRWKELLLTHDIRAGLHSGEIELRGDDVAGMAVHIGARVSALAGAGEVLVSRTVTDLVAGSGIEFEDRGEHELKGVPGTWHLYSVFA